AALALALAACGGPQDPTPPAGGTPVGGGATAGGAGGGTPATGPDATPVGSAPSGAIAAGYLHTKGGSLIDAAGKVVHLRGVSWFGLETSNFAPHGLWSRSMGDLLDAVKRLGFNSIRVPFSNQLFDPGSVPNGVDATKNPDLVGLTGLQILDRLVDGARARGLRVILDRHRPDASGQSELWYTSTVSEARWIADWQMLAARYKGDSTVVAVDLHNEPHGAATWGDGNAATDWRLAAERAGNAVLGVNADLLVIVEGIERYDGATTWWGGNLKGVATAPVRLSVADRVVYSPHDYPASVFPQAWFSDPSYPANLTGVWDAHWGYIARQGIAPVWIGEFGTRDETASDQQWFHALAGYIQGNGLDFAFWSLNPNSGDTGGILQDDWTTVNAAKAAVLGPLLQPSP
ncbi:MAG TPA: glycoside hydrolase family 5 protein, partial [Anaeromyxobacteraceae bacterium]|nr:glycoside hydrolase family 5 protein [Anaeromyxobacteraceae bacterium]